MQTKKRIILGMVLIAMLVQQANALPSWIENNIAETGTDSGYYQTQTRGIYSLGSSSIRFKEMPGTITPFHVTPPRFNVGCGGIDQTMGAFSYFNPEFLIEKLKAIGAAAPAFVYQMAFSALCKDCQNIMNELEKIANMVNGMNFDTCNAIQAAQELGSRVGEAMNNNIMGGDSDGWLGQQLKTGTEKLESWGNNLKSTLGLDDSKKKDLMDMLVLEGSLIDLAVIKGISDSSKLEILGRDPNNDYLLLSAFRAIVGDVIGEKDSKGDPNSFSVPSASTGSDLFTVLYKGGDLQYTSYDKTTKKLKGTAEATYKWEGTKTYITNKLKAIFIKMKAKEALDATDKQFLASLPIPVYRFLNVSVMTNADQAEFDLVSGQISILQTKQIIAYLTKVVGRGVNTYVAIHGGKFHKSVVEGAGKVADKIVAIDTATMNAGDSELKELQSKKTVVDYIKERDREAKARLAQQPFFMSSF